MSLRAELIVSANSSNVPALSRPAPADSSNHPALSR
jgi:hypothetical protein